MHVFVLLVTGIINFYFIPQFILFKKKKKKILAGRERGDFIYNIAHVDLTWDFTSDQTKKKKQGQTQASQTLNNEN